MHSVTEFSLFFPARLVTLILPLLTVKDGDLGEQKDIPEINVGEFNFYIINVWKKFKAQW